MSTYELPLHIPTVTGKVIFLCQPAINSRFSYRLFLSKYAKQLEPLALVRSVIRLQIDIK